MFRFCPGILILFVFAQILYSQTDSKFLLTQWTTENGLPQNTVTSIAQTSDGYLWVGTFGGLARFDGIHFHIFTTSNTPELKSNRITALTTDKDGTLWIGTERGEVIKYFGNQFRLIDDGTKFNNSTVNEIFVDDSGSLLIVGDITRICTGDNCQLFPTPENIVRKFIKDTNGTIWLISKYKLYRQTDGKFIEDSNFHEEIFSFTSNSDGGLWISSFSGLFLYKDGKKQLIRKIEKTTAYSDIIQTNDGNLWFSRNEQIISLKDGKFEEFEFEEIKKKTVCKIFIDNQKNLWLGTIGSGLVRLLKNRVQTFSLRGELGKGNFQNLAANSLVEDDIGNVWIATYISLFRWKNGTIEQVKEFSNLGRQGSLLFDSKKVLWSSTSNGLFSFENEKVISHQEISWKEAESGNSLFEDREGKLWYGCYNCGIIVSDRKKILAKYTKEDGLASNLIYYITQSSDGSMWFGTVSGLSQLKDGKFINYTTKNGLSNDYVRDIYEDQAGTLWIGTYGGGLNRLKDGKITHITTKNGLFDDIVSRILIDDEDNFWMLGNRGIFSVSRQMLNDFAEGKIKQVFCSSYTTADGLITSEGNGGYQNAGIKTKGGKLFFPMIDGIAMIDPKQEKMPPPKPIIEDVVLNENQVDISKKIEINPGNESLEINYTGINFRKPEQIRFRYKLEGLDKGWTDAGTRRLANYPYLPAGNFRFQLQASNTDGNWSETPAEIEIIVHPYFYQTWWFYILCFVVFCWIIYSVYRYRNWLFAMEKAKQEEFARRLINAQENERRRIAADIHDNLGQQLLIIKNWTSYCLKKTKNNDIRPQVKQVNEMTQQALDEVRLLAKNLSPYHLDKIGLTNTIIYMVKQMAESSEIKFETEIDNIDNLFSKESEINLYRIVQESVNNIVKHSKATSAKVFLKRAENFLKLEISDNGIGFYKKEDDFEDLGIGLHGMTERAKMLGGNFVFESNEDRGSVVRVSIEI